MATSITRAPIGLKKGAVEALEADPDRSYFNPVEGKGVPGGLALRVMPSGEKSWVLRYRYQGIQKTLTLGRHPGMTPDLAKVAATEAWGQIHSGVDPSQAKRAERQAALAGVTVSELADRFIKEHIRAEVIRKDNRLFVTKSGPEGNKLSTAKEYVRLIEIFIKPRLGKHLVREVGTSDVAEMLFKVQKHTPIQANRVRAVTSKMFAKAELWELRAPGSNPARGQDRSQERKKDRNLSDKEIRALGEALATMEEASGGQPAPRDMEHPPQPESPQAMAAILLALYTGMRKSEIIGDLAKGIPPLTWDQVDLQLGFLKVHHKTEGKTGQMRMIYLCAAARALLKSLPRLLGNPTVITGNRKGRSLVDLQSPWERIRNYTTELSKERAAKAKTPSMAVDITDVSIHDLRRTFSSVGARLGYQELFLGALLGHSAGTVTQGYARVDGDPLRACVESIGAHVAELLAKKSIESFNRPESDKSFATPLI